MSPTLKLLSLGLMALLIVVLLVRMVVRWLRDRRALAAASRTPSRVPSPPPAAVEPVATSVGAAADSGAAAPRSNASAVVPPGVAAETAPSTGSPTAARTPAPGVGVAERGSDGHALDPLRAEDLPFADTSDYAFGGLTPLLAAMLPESPEKKQRFQRTLANAGYYTPHAWHNFAAVRYLGIVIPILVFGALLVMVPPRLESLVLGALVVFPILGYSLPALMVQSQAASRLREIEQAMPDMLDMLNMCVSQGMTLPQSLERVGRELRDVYPDLAKELSIVSAQGRIAGLPAALSSFANRVDTPEVQTFTSLLVQTERMGTSVSRALADYSQNIRESLRQRADRKANSAAFKLLFPTVLCLMPAVFLFLLGPAIVQLHDFYKSGGTETIRRGAAAVLEDEQP